jgi:hypothetical protein
MAKAFLVILLFPISVSCAAQKEAERSVRIPMPISLIRFNNLVDSCTGLLETKKYSQISDSGNIYIIMCSNTIFYTRMKNGYDRLQRFEGGRYGRFDVAIRADSAAYSKILGFIYHWEESAGLGMYFPKLDIQFGGKLDRHSLFEVAKE